MSVQQLTSKNQNQGHCKINYIIFNSIERRLILDSSEVPLIKEQERLNTRIGDITWKTECFLLNIEVVKKLH